MTKSSELLENEFIINDDSDHLEVVPEGQSTGLDFSSRTKEGYAGYAAAFDPSKLMPMDEIISRIQLQESTKTRISDMIRVKNLPPKNQQQTNFCWMNAPVHSLEIRRLKMNEAPVILSPASAACRLTKFKNVGGWGLDAVKFLSNPNGGCCPVEIWPANAIDKKYDTAAAEAAAKNFIFSKWIALDPNNLQQVASMVLRGFPVPVGYDWWGHEVTVVDMVMLDGQLCPRIRNSWGLWGDGFGFAVLQGSKALPSDAVCCIDAIVSSETNAPTGSILVA